VLSTLSCRRLAAEAAGGGDGGGSDAVSLAEMSRHGSESVSVVTMSRGVTSLVSVSDNVSGSTNGQNASSNNNNNHHLRLLGLTSNRAINTVQHPPCRAGNNSRHAGQHYVQKG